MSDEKPLLGCEVRTDTEIDDIYRAVDRLLCEGDFAEVDTQLDAIDPSKLPIVIGLAWATITFPARRRLARRGAYMARLRKHCVNIDPARAEALLRGLAQDEPIGAFEVHGEYLKKVPR